MTNGADSAIIMGQVLDKPPVHVLYPRVQGLGDKRIQEKINLVIERKVNDLILFQGGQKDLQELRGNYEVTLNQMGQLSLRFEMFAQIRMAAHPSTMIDSLTVDLNTGQEYELYHLFRNMSAHALVITNFLLKQIEREQIPLIVDLKLIPDNHPYYLTGEALVVYFQEAELAPRSYGILEFPVAYNYVKSIIDPAGPLRQMVET